MGNGQWAVVKSLPPPAHFPFPTAHCPLPTHYCLLPTAGRTRPPAYCRPSPACLHTSRIARRPGDPDHHPGHYGGDLQIRVGRCDDDQRDGQYPAASGCVPPPFGAGSGGDQQGRIPDSDPAEFFKSKGSGLGRKDLENRPDRAKRSGGLLANGSVSILYQFGTVFKFGIRFL